MSDTEEEFSTTGTITCDSLEGDTMQTLLARGGGGALPSGQYQIGPFTVTPSDDQSGMLEYVVRMQDALQEAIQVLHQKEVKISQLSQQLSQLLEEKNHVTVKLNALTRTVQEKDTRMRVATQEVEKLKRNYRELEEEEPRKAATENKKKLTEVRKDLSALKKVEKDLNMKVRTLEKDKQPLEVQVGALEEQLQTSMGRHKSLEEQHMAAQEQVSALAWKLQAFEQQYAALYQQYSNTIRADGHDQDQDVSRVNDLPPPAATLEGFSPPSAPTIMSSVTDTSEEAPLEDSEKQPLMSHTCSNCGSSKSGKTRIGGTIHRRRYGGLLWLPERLATVLSLRSAPRFKVVFIIYLLVVHIYLVAFCLFCTSDTTIYKT